MKYDKIQNRSQKNSHSCVPLRDVMGEKNLEGIPVDSVPSPNVPLQVKYFLFFLFWQYLKTPYKSTVPLYKHDYPDS